MKSRFSTIDLFAVIHDLKLLEGLRVANIYDVDHKTYMLRMQASGTKCFIMFESGSKIYVSKLEWSKSQFPSSFSMKLRKHIKQKRLERVEQLGIDRVVDMQFGSNELACHVLVELYDRGNIVLTDHDYTILNVLRPRTDKDTDVKIFVKEKYPLQNIRREILIPDELGVKNILTNAKVGEALKKVLVSCTHYGPSLIEHCMLDVGFEKGLKISAQFCEDSVLLGRIMKVFLIARELFDTLRKNPSKGYLTVNTQQRADGTTLETYEEFHPYCFKQFDLAKIRQFDSFSECLDEFFSNLESQKADRKALHVEREAMKKLLNVRKDQEMSWERIEEMKAKASDAGDYIAKTIIGLDLASNAMTLSLQNPYDSKGQCKKVTVDIGLSAYQNARKLHSEKKAAIEKKQKTLQSSAKALRSAELKTKHTVETVRTKADVMKSRQQMWFEKFYWFLSSDGYLIIGGRDAHQNELLVRRYLRSGDVYVHADVRGASSVVIRNRRKDNEIPPKTLNEAGIMAVCYSSAWEAKVFASAWWVHHHQVSKSAPTGEYLPSGSFMIRGKKNYLPVCSLQLGFGLLFKLDEDSLERRQENHEEHSCQEQQDLEEKEKRGNEESMSDLEEEDENPDVSQSDFPDVHINIDDILVANEDSKNDNYTILQLGPVTAKQNVLSAAAKTLGSDERNKEVQKAAEKKNRPMTKREKHKAEKIKKKYRDQDEEERELRLKILASRPVELSKKKDPGISVQSIAKNEDSEEKKKSIAANEIPETVPSLKKQLEEPEEPEDESDVISANEEDVKMLNSLTWRPVPDDTLLYAVAVVGPYTTMQKFKYKVKLTPGTGKRGKAAKNAIAFFQKITNTTPQEQSLMRVIAADDQLARNIPGKVRIWAKQLNKMK